MSEDPQFIDKVREVVGLYLVKCLYLALRSLDPTGRGRQRWAIRWKPALDAFTLMFEGRIFPNDQ